MRVGNYSVVVPEGIERESGHVELDHGRQYTLRLMSHDHRQCDAEVTIDGKYLDTFRLRGHGQVTLERMPNDTGRLTFYSSGTDEAGQAGELSVAVPDKGLIQVRLVPEKYRAPVPTPTTGHVLRSKSMRPIGMCSFAGQEEKTSGGITGLSGHSGQQFVNVEAINREESEAVTISIRLVTGNTGPRPLRASAGTANPVPQPV